jgi:hypothetical protein
MKRTWEVSRRSVLRGLGTAIALPWLEATSAAADLAARAQASATGSPVGPLRMAFFYVPNGVHIPSWTPEAIGPGFELPATLEPLAPFRDKLTVLTGLAQQNGFSLGDGPGDHARALGSFLTGAHPLKTDGANIRAGISVDQVAAEKVGHLTRFRSLELGIDRGAQAGGCDSGYSCAYSSNIAWRSETTPVAKEVNPRLVFDRLFAGNNKDESAAARAKRELYHKSILDFVNDDASGLVRRLGSTDRRKLEEYLTCVRELEVRISRAEQGTKVDLNGVARPEGIPEDYREHVRLMFDLMVLAFQGDVTRISTFMYANEGSTKSYSFIGVPEGHHDLSHHGGNPEKHEKLKKINRFHVEQFAYLLSRLESIREGDASLLDRSMLVYGSGLSDGNRHNHNNLPVFLVGNGGGTIQAGRHIKLESQTPLNNLYLSILDRMGTPIEELGDSTGRLKEIDV